MKIKKSNSIYITPALAGGARERKTFWSLVFAILALGIVTPVLAAYLGPNRTTESTKVVTYDYGVWARDNNKLPYCLDKNGNIADACIICEWERNPGTKCGDATYSYKLGTRSEEVTTVIDLPPATISNVLQNCTLSNGWCNTSAKLFLSGAEPLSGYSITTIEGSLNGLPFACSGANCTVPLSEGNNSFTFWALSSYGDSSTQGTVTAKVDTVSPNVGMGVSGSSGANGWYIGPAVVSATATDVTSGINTLLISDNGGPGKPSPVTLNNGIHALTVTATDKAGNSKSISQTVKVDTSGPIITPTMLGTSGMNGWYRSAVDLSTAASDALSGVQGNVEVSLDNGVSWTTPPINFTDGIHPLILRAYDQAGNLSTSSLTLKVDSTSPTFNISTLGTMGNAYWYVSPITTSITPNDTLSGVARVEYNQNAAGWQTGTSVTSGDGINTIVLRVYDIAGNMASGSVTVRVDTAPPLITPSLSGTSGSNGWLVSPSTVSVTTNDTTSGVNGEPDVSFDGGLTWQSAPVLLNDGEYSLTFRAFDIAGNEGMALLNASIDTTVPTLNFVYSGTPGANGWYVSAVQVSTSASDFTSGLDVAELRVDEGVWSPLSQTLSDGIYSLDARAEDKAGNTKTISDILRIDTVLPSSNYASHTDNSLVSGLVHLAGTSSDSNGLQSVEVSLDGGMTWQATTLSSGAWSYDWNTATIPNGTYIAQIRATDVAGNQENPVPLTLVVDNLPPHVKITDFWWIWQSGEFHVSPNTFAVSEITVKISDPQNRWSPVRLTYNPVKTSSAVIWDRRFPGGVIAPMGNYWAEITACDVHGNCASDKGQIKIPILAPIPSTAIPTTATIPSPVSTITTLVPTETVVATPSATPVPAQVINAHPTPKKSGSVSGPTWVVLILTLLVLFFGILYLLDPRPKALRSLARTMNQFNKE